MIPGWLTKLLAGIVVIVSLSVIANLIASQTLFSSSYVKQQFTKIDAYNRLSKTLSEEAAKQTGIDNPQVTAAIQQVVTPETLQQRIEDAITQGEAYYKGEGQPPTINVSDLTDQLQTAGVPITANSELNRPIELVPTTHNATNATPATAKLQGVKVVSIVLLVLLLIALVAVSITAKNYTILPNVFIACGIALIPIALLLSLSAGIFDHYVKFDVSTNAYTAIAHDLVKNISTDIGHRYALIAVALLAVGVISRLILARLHINQANKNHS
jgi:hypothetical protein